MTAIWIDPRPEKQQADEFVPESDDRTFTVMCTGKSPLMMDQWDERAMGHIGPCLPGTCHRVQGIIERCRVKIYRDAEGYPILHSSHLACCLKAAGRSIKVSHRQLFNSRRRADFVLHIPQDESRLQFPADKNPLCQLPAKLVEDSEQFDPCSPWCADVRRPSGNLHAVANALVRPMFERWSFTFQLRMHRIWFEGIGGHDTLVQLLERAGNRVGLLSYRPACNGPFGRFRVDSVTSIETDK